MDKVQEPSNSQYDYFVINTREKLQHNKTSVTLCHSQRDVQPRVLNVSV
jgi:hypothetical protein